MEMNEMNCPLNREMKSLVGLIPWPSNLTPWKSFASSLYKEVSYIIIRALDFLTHSNLPYDPCPYPPDIWIPEPWTPTQTIIQSAQFPQYNRPISHPVYVIEGLGLNQYIPNLGDWLQISGNMWHNGSTKAMFKGLCFDWRGRGGYVGRVAQ